jgi:hypothetical protein
VLGAGGASAGTSEIAKALGIFGHFADFCHTDDKPLTQDALEFGHWGWVMFARQFAAVVALLFFVVVYFFASAAAALTASPSSAQAL